VEGAATLNLGVLLNGILHGGESLFHELSASGQSWDVFLVYYVEKLYFDISLPLRLDYTDIAGFGGDLPED
jgi:hypothetical protein